jgi:hypothetical protein
VSVIEHSSDGQAGQGYPRDVERRVGERRNLSRASVGHVGGGRNGERRGCMRRRSDSGAGDVPSLFCPDCLGPLQYEAGLSWNLPGAYTVDAGYCSTCSRRFLRNRETGDYDALSW